MSADTAFRHLRDANPVPDPAALRERRPDAVAFLATTQQRSRRMQTQDKPINVEQLEPPRSPRSRWLIPALAGAATVIVAIVVAVALLSGDDEPDVTNEPSPTETTTAADVAVASEVTVVMSSYEAMNNGDIDGYLALLTEEASVREGRDLLQVLVNMNEQSELAEPCHLIKPTPAGEARVSCTATFSNDFHGPGGVTATLTESFVVTDAGKISLRFTTEGNFALNLVFNAAFLGVVDGGSSRGPRRYCPPRCGGVTRCRGTRRRT